LPKKESVAKNCGKRYNESVTSGQNLKKLALARLRTAKILLSNNESDVAVYLLGYVVEFALKAIICKKLDLTTYPPVSEDWLEKTFKTHSFDALLLLAGLSNKINANAPADLWYNWTELTKWRVDMRYDPIGTYKQSDVEEKIKALESKPNGLLTWIRRKKIW